MSAPKWPRTHSITRQSPVTAANSYTSHKHTYRYNTQTQTSHSWHVTHYLTQCQNGASRISSRGPNSVLPSHISYRPTFSSFSYPPLLMQGPTSSCRVEMLIFSKWLDWILEGFKLLQKYVAIFYPSHLADISHCKLLLMCSKNCWMLLITVFKWEHGVPLFWLAAYE